jgi:hypothetical protein
LRTNATRRVVRSLSPCDSACTALWWKTRPFDRASFEHAPLAGFELVEPSREQRLD